MTSKQKNAALHQEKAPSKTQPAQHSKKAVILAIMRTGRSLNRFEAERLGDHCLHSTIAELRKDGHIFHDVWEWVSTRFGREVHVKRYRYIGQLNG